MHQKRCWICGAGEFTGRLFSPKSGDLIVAADGGLVFLNQLSVVPDYIVGDFDSLGYRPQGNAVASYPSEKDDTDMLLAVKYGLEHGCKTFLIYGSLGGRLSHTMANLQVLYDLYVQGCHGILIDTNSIVTMIRNESLTFAQPCEGMISLFAQHGTAEGVTIKNLKYCIEDALLSPAYPIGVSNEFIGHTAEVSVKHGTLLAIWESQLSDFDLMQFEAMP